MIPTAFNYKRTNTIDEAINSMNDGAKVLGGGQSLIPALKLRLNFVDTLVDISKIESIQKISDNEGSISIGAGVTHAQLAASDVCAKHCPMIVEAAKEIGDIQVRNKGTIGGSIAHADPAADWPAVLLAADANVTIQNKDGKRTVDIDQFFTGFYETALEDGEIITAISIPKSAANANSCYVKFKQPASRFAIVGCAAAAEKEGGTIKSLRLGITGVGETPYRAMNIEKGLQGQTLNEGTIEEHVQNATEGADVMSDHYASEKYRTHLAHVYIKRALSRLS